jgi:hypothetical protein
MGTRRQEDITGLVDSREAACRIPEKKNVALPNVIHEGFRQSESPSEWFSAFSMSFSLARIPFKLERYSAVSAGVHCGRKVIPRGILGQEYRQE